MCLFVVKNARILLPIDTNHITIGEKEKKNLNVTLRHT